MKLSEIKLFEAAKEFTSEKELLDFILAKYGKRISPPVSVIKKSGELLVAAHAVDFSKMKIFAKPLPFRFSKVMGRYNVRECLELKSLSQLNVEDSIEWLYAPYTMIKDFEGCPPSVEIATFDNTNITSLKGISKDIEELSIFHCSDLTEIDAPMPKLKKLSAAGCGFKSLKDIHKNCPNLVSLQINACPITSHLLGLLKLEHIKPNVLGGRAGNSPSPREDKSLYDRLDRAWKIVQKHLESPPGNKRVMECQSELLDNELDEYAQL